MKYKIKNYMRSFPVAHFFQFAVVIEKKKDSASSKKIVEEYER